MHLELWRRIAQRGQCSDDRDLAAFQVQARARVHVSKWKFDQLAGKVRSNALQALQNALTGLAVDLTQFCEPAFVAVFDVHQYVLHQRLNPTPRTARKSGNTRFWPARLPRIGASLRFPQE